MFAFAVIAVENIEHYSKHSTCKNSYHTARRVLWGL